MRLQSQPLLFLIFLGLLSISVSSCMNTEEQIIHKINQEYDITFDHNRSMFGDEYISYEKLEILNQNNKRIKNCISNIVKDSPISDTIMNPYIDKGDTVVLNYYRWETPKKCIELFIGLKENGYVRIRFMDDQSWEILQEGKKRK